MKPKLRFKGYEEEWKRVKLGEILEIDKSLNSSDIYNRNDVLSVTDEYGLVNQIKYQGRSFAGASLSNYRVTLKGQIVYTKSPLKSSPYGIIKSNSYGEGILSPLYAVYNTIENVQDSFIHYYFDQKARLNNYLLPLINKGAKNTILISDNEALQGNIIHPSSSEQTSIGEYFKRLDEAINKSESEISKLKQIKKASLQSMFPQPGETKPKLRFKGFNDDWKEVKLNSICAKLASNHSENSLGKNIGNFPIFGATGYIQNIPSYDLSIPYIGIVKDGSGAGRSHIYPPFSSILGTMQYIIPNKDTNITFLLNVLNSIDFSLFTTGSSIPHIYFKDYGELKILTPSFEEQEKIGAFFANLDSQISLLAKKLEKLKQVKKGCLAQMFV